MKKLSLLTAISVLLLSACQSNDSELLMSGKEAITSIDAVEEIKQISDDVNSREVNNILGSLFGKERKSRSESYTVSMIKDKDGIDRIICINYDDNGGFALISADKTHSPILAYSEEGNFTVDGELPLPLSDWMDCTMHSIADSETLPIDSLETIARMWRKYCDPNISAINESIKSPKRLSSIDWDIYYNLTRQMMDKMSEWNSNGYRVYSIDEYDGTTAIGDNNAIASYVQGIIEPSYVEEYNTLTLIVEKDIEYKRGKGHWMQVNWEQTNGYNQSFEFKTDKPDTRIPVGCGPLAVGQIMYSYRFPDTFNWAAMNIYGSGNKATSDFLLDVFNKCKARYEPPCADNNYIGGTYSNRFYCADALRSYGYKYDNVSKIDPAQLLDNPAIIDSKLERIEADGDTLRPGHSWVVEGGLKIETHIQVEIWTFKNEYVFECVYSEPLGLNYITHMFYVNWGWGDGTKAYYNLESMIPEHRNFNSNKIRGGLVNIRPGN